MSHNLTSFQSLVGTIVKMYSILLHYLTRIFSDTYFLDALGCGFGSVSVSLPIQKGRFLKRGS